jgi:hypothetical protein
MRAVPPGRKQEMPFQEGLAGAKLREDFFLLHRLCIPVAVLALYRRRAAVLP